MPRMLTILSNMGWRNQTYRRRQQVQQYFHDVRAGYATDCRRRVDIGRRNQRQDAGGHQRINAVLQIIPPNKRSRPLQKSPSPDSRNPNTGFRLFPPPNTS